MASVVPFVADHEHHRNNMQLIIDNLNIVYDSKIQII